MRWQVEVQLIPCNCRRLALITRFDRPECPPFDPPVVCPSTQNHSSTTPGQGKRWEEGPSRSGVRGGMHNTASRKCRTVVPAQSEHQCDRSKGSQVGGQELAAQRPEVKRMMRMFQGNEKARQTGQRQAAERELERGQSHFSTFRNRGSTLERSKNARE